MASVPWAIMKFSIQSILTSFRIYSTHNAIRMWFLSLHSMKGFWGAIAPESITLWPNYNEMWITTCCHSKWGIVDKCPSILPYTRVLRPWVPPLWYSSLRKFMYSSSSLQCISRSHPISLQSPFENLPPHPTSTLDFATYNSWNIVRMHN